MGLLSQQWRERADELDKASKPLLESLGVVPAQVQAVKAVVLPELMLAMADMLDVLEASPAADKQTQTARERMQRNQRIRTAAATGDWDVIDRIINDAVTVKESAN